MSKLKVTLKPSFACGNSSYTSANHLDFLGENTLLRSVGRRLATYNTATSEVKFLPERPGASVSAFAAAHGSKLLAVAETDDKNFTVTTFNVQTWQRQETIELPGRVASLSFSSDATILAALCPDTCQAPDGAEILSQAWLKGGVLALAFSSGDVMLKQDSVISVITIAAGASLNSIAAFERGFVVGGTNASIAFMEPSTEAERQTGAGKYRLLRSLRLPANNRGVRCIAVSQSDIPGALDNLAAETGDGDLLLLDRDSFNLTSAADEAKPLIDTDAGPSLPKDEKESEHQLNLLQSTGAGFHRGRLIGFDIGGVELLLASISIDRTLRVYEIQAKALRFAKQLIDMPKCIAVHPMGFMILMGFAVELNLYYLLRDDIELVTSFPLRHCGRVKFSHHGHLFAAVDAAFSIHLYNAHDRAHLCELKGHQAPVSSLSWSLDDAQLASLGAAAAYRWDVPYKTRVHADSIVHKGTIYCSGQLMPGGGLRAWETRQGEIPVPASVAGPLVLAGAGRVLLAGTGHGEGTEDQIRELRVAVKAAHREGEYQASMAMRGLQEKMAQAMQRADAANSKLAERTAEMDQDRDERNADYMTKAVELEDSHAKAAERLQAACERRVEMAQHEVLTLEASKADLRYANEEVVLRVDAGHAKLLQEVKEKFKQQLDKAADRYSDLEAAKDAMEKEYRQMLSMYDDEFEDGTEALQEVVKQ
ncbi:hypothetical protein WJX84_006999, partial [Apatococcus fuscideae]